MHRPAPFRGPRVRSRVLGALGFLLGGAAIPAFAQDPPVRLDGVQEEVVVERVVIDAHVIGPDGNPIPGLTPDNFRVKIDGRPVILEDVEWLPGDKPENDASALVGIETEEAERFRQDAPPGRLIVFFFQHDGSQTTRLHGLVRMSHQARRFLDTLLETDRIAVVSYDSQLKLRQDFTSDREKILKAITASVGTSPAPPPDLTRPARHSAVTSTATGRRRPARRIGRSRSSRARSSLCPAASRSSSSVGGSEAPSAASRAPSHPRARTSTT